MSATTDNFYNSAEQQMKRQKEEQTINQCPEFPFFGAYYPDATCVNGVLYDLDDCDENGNLYEKGDIPCPFCQTDAFLEYELGNKEDYDTPEEYQEALNDVKSWMQSVKEKY